MGEHQKRKVDTKEFELPETFFIRDIENKVFQGIVLQCLTKIDGIALAEGTFIDNIFGKGSLEGVKGIHVEQDNKNHSVAIKVDVNIGYGFSIPEKAEEIQQLCAEEITRLTGLHVSTVHIVFKNVIMPEELKKSLFNAIPLQVNGLDEEYNDEF